MQAPVTERAFVWCSRLQNRVMHMKAQLRAAFHADPAKLSDMTTAFNGICLALGVRGDDEARRQHVASVVVDVAKRAEGGLAQITSRALLVLTNVKDPVG